jgi:DNA-3-methyladenine glycosylase I
MKKVAAELSRCAWAKLNNPLYLAYHDEEWGVPLHDEQMLFEFIVLEGAQAGLSWETILNRRAHYRTAFDNFDVRKVAAYREDKINELLNNASIIRNRLKINAAIVNARAFLNIQAEFGSFDKFIWQFIGGRPVKNSWRTSKEVPAKTVQSDEMSRALIKYEFKFVGSTICYAFMQATGMVNDHLTSCFRYSEIKY